MSGRFGKLTKDAVGSYAERAELARLNDKRLSGKGFQIGQRWCRDNYGKTKDQCRTWAKSQGYGTAEVAEILRGYAEERTMMHEMGVRNKNTNRGFLD
jgi:hypothetical protein